MSISTLTLGGREYVVLPRKQYEELTAVREERAMVARAEKALAQYRAGKLKTVSSAKVKKILGL
jgi:hypothetical protein